MAKPNEGELLRLFYQVFIDDIRYSKKQQWNTIYLTLVALGAILALFLALPSKQILPQWVLQLFVALIAGLGVGYIGRFHKSMTEYRKEKKQLLDRFSSESKKAKEIAKKEPEGFFGKDFWFFVVPFWMLIAVAAVLVAYLIIC